jgi:hypothetical protein
MRMIVLRHPHFLALLLLSPIFDFARETPGESPAFTTVPELRAGFDLLYEQRFAEAREAFASWESRNPEEPLGEVAIAAAKYNSVTRRAWCNRPASNVI